MFYIRYQLPLDKNHFKVIVLPIFREMWQFEILYWTYIKSYVWRWHTLSEWKFCTFWSKLDKLYSINFWRVSNQLNICVHKQVLIYKTSYDYLLWKQAPPNCWQASSRMSEWSLIQHFCILMSGRNWWAIYILIFPF